MQIIWHGKIVGSWIFGLTFIRYLLYVFIYVLEFLTSARNPVEYQILKFLIHHILILVEGATFGDHYILSLTHTLSFQVNNLLQVAQNYQTAVSESGPAGISNNDAQTICNMLVSLFYLQ